MLRQLASSACHPSSLLLFHPALFFCSFKEGASHKAAEGGSKQGTNWHSQIPHEFLQLGLRLAELSGETQITEGPENSQVMEARRMGTTALNVSACRGASEVSVWRDAKQMGLPLIRCA